MTDNSSDDEEWWHIEPADVETEAKPPISELSLKTTTIDDENEPSKNFNQKNRVTFEVEKEQIAGPSFKPRSMRQLKESNRLRKHIRAICEEESRKYREFENEEDFCNRYREIVSLRNKQIENIFETIKLTKNVDLCFLIDATGSMNPHIKGSRDSINNIVSKLVSHEEGNVERLRLAIVAYRDYKDKNRFEILDFTSFIDKFHEFCGKIVADGGDDGPEDVLGGLNEALKLNWDYDQSGTKLIFHISDAPCHGIQFHDSMQDNYPTGDIYGLTHTELFEKLRENGIQYSFGKITNHTDIMLTKFAEVYRDQILTFDIKDVDLICKSVVRAVRESVMISSKRATSTITGENGQRLKEKEFVLIKTEPNWNSLETIEGVYITYNLPRSIDDLMQDVPLERNKPKRVQIKISQNPFARGAERIAFYGRDMTSGLLSFFKRSTSHKDIVLKEYAHEYSGNIAKRFETSNQVQTISAFLAKRFCEECQIKADLDVSIEFLNTKTLAIKNGDGTHRYMTCEDRFSPADIFIRFSNNVDYKIIEEQVNEYGIPMEYVDLLMCFSHWTYKITQEILMVVDLQGIITKSFNSTGYRFILTDPAIHCLDPTRFGRTNLSTQGMKTFLNHHTCNKFCEVLGLKSRVVVV